MPIYRNAIVSVGVLCGFISAAHAATDTVSTWTDSNCISSRFEATKSARSVYVKYSMRDTCQNRLLAFGDGDMPLRVWGGSITGGSVSVNVNVADIPGYAYGLTPQTFALTFRRSPALYKIETLDTVIDGPNVEGTHTTQKIRGYSADVTGWTTLGLDVPGQGYMNSVGSVVPK